MRRRHPSTFQTELNLQLTAAGAKLVVLDFYADWCGPCKMIAPILEELNNVEPNVVFIKINVDESEEIAEKFNITGMPTFIFIKNNKPVSSFI
uniref:Thioredoxin domain-containing protein n=1 Tax=Timema tahoe TaxID=61484 RepID=A0A7R9P0R0_9NEOP|nr:unnamed protein product [Timema tahoe]